MDKAETRRAVKLAVIKAMETTDIPEISITSICREAGVSRSTFYRYFESVDDVVKQMEDELIASLRRVSRFDKSKTSSSPLFGNSTADIIRAEILYEHAPFIRVVTGIHGDPSFSKKAVNLIRENMAKTYGTSIEGIPHSDFMMQFIMAGSFNLISYWLNEHPEISPEEMCSINAELFGRLNAILFGT